MSSSVSNNLEFGVGVFGEANGRGALPPWLDLGSKRRFLDDPLTLDTSHPGRLLPIVDLGAHEFGDNPPGKVGSR